MLNEMTVFAQVVESGGFSAAARLLRLETSSVSRSVARLEKHLGTRLLHRTTRAIALTEVGEQVFKECARIAGAVRDVRSLANRFHAAPQGTLRLSAPVAFGQLWLAPRLAAFMEVCPAVDLRVMLIDRPVDLIEDGVDVAVRISADWPPGMVVRKLMPVRYVLIASPSYLTRHGGQSASVTVDSRVTLNNSIAIAAAAEAGGGIGLIPEFSARAGLDSGRLVEVLADWGFGVPYLRDASLVYMPGPHIAHKVRAFIDYLVSTL